MLNEHSCGTEQNNLNIVDLTTVAPTMQQATMSFHDASPGHGSSIVSKFEETYSHGSTSDVPLGEFLKRPVLISNLSWDTGSNFNFILDPWLDYFATPEISKKVEGYRFLRGNLNVRFVVTGNPFLFGRIIAAYEPLARRSVWKSSGAYGNELQRVYKTVLSQMPHVYLDASTSQGGEMVLPFFSPYNWLDLSSFTSLLDMGTIRMTNLTPLQHANAPVGKCQVLIYAWMDDAELCVPTASAPRTEIYQGNETDEFSSGVISKPASAVARAAGMLAKIPVFEPFALPTEMAATAVGAAASHFGFSRPPILDNIQPVREKFYGNLSNTNTHEMCERLSLDAKGQLTLDSRTVGLDGTDEMALSHILSRETLLNSVTWDESNVVGDRIWSFRVGPTYHSLDTTSTPSRNGLPPCTAVASMFRQWRGTMVYRFSVCASALHRGKIRVSYEPTPITNIGQSDEVYSRIVDLAETRDFEIPVHWHQPTPWQKVKMSSLGDASDTHYYSGSPVATSQAVQHFNGLITLTVLTPLTSPDPSLSQPIHLLFYVKGGPDLEFADPVGQDLQFSLMSSNIAEEPQGRTELDDAADNDDAPPEANNALPAIGDHPGTLTDPLAHVFHGESVTSLRAYLKRYRRQKAAFTDEVPQVPAGLRSNVRGEVTAFYMGQKEFIMSWYVGWRGSTRFKVGTVNGVRPIFTERVYRPQNTFDMNGHSGLSANLYSNEVEVPFHSYKRFALTRTSPSWASDTNIDTLDPNNSAILSGGSSSQGAEFYSVDLSATGEDFSLFFFLGIPPVFVNV